MEMMNQNRAGMTDRAGLFILIAFMGAGFVVGGGFSVVLWKVMTGQSILQMQTSMMNPAFVNTETDLNFIFLVSSSMSQDKTLEAAPLNSQVINITLFWLPAAISI